MKLFIFLMALLGAALAHAESSQVCGTLIPCGTYQRVDETGGKKILHELIFTATGLSGVKIEIAKTEDGQRTFSEAVMTFTQEGVFTVTKPEGITAAGICRENACSMSIAPYLYNGEQHEQAVIFRFSVNTVQMAKLTVDAGGKLYPTDVTYSKNP